MVKDFLSWGASSLTGHFVVSLVAVALPIFLLGLITNIRSGYPTADLGMLIVLPVLVAIPPALFVWYNVTLPRIKRRAAQAKEDASRDL